VDVGTKRCTTGGNVAAQSVEGNGLQFYFVDDGLTFTPLGVFYERRHAIRKGRPCHKFRVLLFNHEGQSTV
jgi:hypothetical protein